MEPKHDDLQLYLCGYRYLSGTRRVRRFTGGGSSASTTATNGWAAGAGLEYAFARNWTIRVEYLHIQFNGTGEALATSGTAGGVGYTATINNSANVNMDIGRVGLNFLFH